MIWNTHTFRKNSQIYPLRFYCDAVRAIFRMIGQPRKHLGRRLRPPILKQLPAASNYISVKDTV